MPRFFSPITINELKVKILFDSIFSKDDREDDRVCSSIESLSPQVRKDLSKVKFSDENFTCSKTSWAINAGYGITPHGLAYLCCRAGGDWEVPIYFIIYWDGKKLRGYIPEKGNPWNRKTNEALTDVGDDDQKMEDCLPEWDKIEKDIEARIVKK